VAGHKRHACQTDQNPVSPPATSKNGVTRRLPSLTPHMTLRPRRQDHLAFRQIARRRGIGPSTLARLVIAEWCQTQSDEATSVQVPVLPEGLNTQFADGLAKRENKRKTLKDERPTAMGMLVDK
jgi:hypothetical protein